MVRLNDPQTGKLLKEFMPIPPVANKVAATSEEITPPFAGAPASGGRQPPVTSNDPLTASDQGADAPRSPGLYGIQDLSAR